MPEIAEVARIVRFLRQHLVGKTLAVVHAQEDSSVFGKAGTSAADVQSALTGKKVLDAGQQGKYFWLIMSSSPHPVMHFGMTGWIHIRGCHTAYDKSKPGQDSSSWPPKYWKLTLESEESPKVEVSFSDPRRFSRIRLVDCPADEIRRTTPLKENGPDPVIDKEILTEEWLGSKLKSRHVPLKALLLDQAVISGIGNWVGDEILYQACLHPEQYSDTFSPEQISRLHASIMHVCDVAVCTLTDIERPPSENVFPDGWLFPHRWGKGKKDKPAKMPDGSDITFLTVGGRTSCIVPSRQKKTGGDVAADMVDMKPRRSKAADMKEEDVVDTSEIDESAPASSSQKKRKAPTAKTTPTAGKKTKPNGPPATALKSEDEAGSDGQPEDPPAKALPERKRKLPPPPVKSNAKDASSAPRRRSGRRPRG